MRKSERLHVSTAEVLSNLPPLVLFCIIGFCVGMAQGEEIQAVKDTYYRLITFLVPLSLLIYFFSLKLGKMIRYWPSADLENEQKVETG